MCPAGGTVLGSGGHEVQNPLLFAVACGVVHCECHTLALDLDLVQEASWLQENSRAVGQ